MKIQKAAPYFLSFDFFWKMEAFSQEVWKYYFLNLIKSFSARIHRSFVG